MKLTRAEEEVMQILWEKGEAPVKELLECFPDPKPARNTVSTFIRILEKKGIVSHRPQGSGYTYYPLVTKEEYSKKQLFSLIRDYFNNSFPAMASFFAKENDLSISELEELMDEARREMLSNADDNDANKK